jgi:SPOR domain
VPLRRDSLSSLHPQAPAQVPAPVPWPTQGYADHGQPAQAGPAYHFPPPDPDPNYGYNQPVYAPQQWGQQQDQQGYDLANYLPPSDAPPRFAQTAHHQQAYGDHDADYGDEFYDDEEPRRGRRWIFIAAALIGAIGVGGALAYTYRSLIAPHGGRVPLLKAESTVKVKPEVRGGKEFAGQDRKLPNRTAEAPPPADAEPQSEPPAGDGTRTVKTIQVGPQTPPVRPRDRVSIPGITLDDSGPPQRPEAPPPAVASTAPVVPSPVTSEVAEPSAPAEPPGKADKDDDDPPAPPSPPVMKRPSPPTPPPTRVATTGSLPKAATSSLGYVVVLSSKKTHMDALKAYADINERHPQLLNNRTPDVQEANLGEKGIYYRTLVGPPSSRDAAVTFCNQLKAAGQDCWVMEYRGS